ncbi:MAG: GerMN domain-containing protein [Patescibacteria group bacterium]
MKNLALAILIVLIVIVGVLLYVRTTANGWKCLNGQWIQYGNPTTLMPAGKCADNSADFSNEVTLTNFKTGDLIKSPFLLEGEAKGTWFFEANLPIKLLDAQGKILAEVGAQATENWMTERFVPFKATLNFTPTTSAGTLIVSNDNPSGLPENSKSVSFPVRFEPVETTIIKIFFNNNELDKEMTCVKVFPVERTIAKTAAVGQASLEELLSGATQKEKANDYFSNINDGVKLNKLTIENGVAKADFSDQLEAGVGGSCRVSAIRSQITETLKQFPTVKEVIISINGKTEDILQP